MNYFLACEIALSEHNIFWLELEMLACFTQNILCLVVAKWRVATRNSGFTVVETFYKTIFIFYTNFWFWRVFTMSIQTFTSVKLCKRKFFNYWFSIFEHHTFITGSL